jgi:hypothetical protein
MASGNGSANGSTGSVDVVVVGAGFAGLYLLHRLRGLGYSAVCLEAADGVGGTWYWNRYPGARCDIMTVDYSFSFDPELEKEWTWSEKYATQPEILRYANYVADKYDLRKDIRFSTKVTKAVWDEGAKRWHVGTSSGDTIECRYYVMATGCLSLPKDIDIEGTDRFAGEVYYTHHWLVRHPVDPDHRRAGLAAHRLPAHAQLLAPRAQRAGAAAQARRVRRRPRRLPPQRPLLPGGRDATGDPRAGGDDGLRGGAPGQVRGGLALR